MAQLLAVFRETPGFEEVSDVVAFLTSGPMRRCFTFYFDFHGNHSLFVDKKEQDEVNFFYVYELEEGDEVEGDDEP